MHVYRCRESCFEAEKLCNLEFNREALGDVRHSTRLKILMKKRN